MPILKSLVQNTMESFEVFWILARIMVPLTILVEVLFRAGVITAIAPAFAPVMNMIGLPAELGLAWLVAMLVGIWAAVPLLFTLVPVTSMSVADVTIFSALILFAHGLPIEQKIINKVGPGMVITTALRLIGGLLYALLLHHILSVTNWLAEPVDPVWIPMSATQDWKEFFIHFSETMIWMLIILVILSWSLEIIKATGLLELAMKPLLPILRLVGIHRESGYLTIVGLFLGISYGAGLLIREARSNTIPPRQLFLSCVFMGFSHSIIEDTLVVMALGADVYGVLVGRLIFTIVATAVVANLLLRLPDRAFFSICFQRQIQDQA